jgi:putative transcriptional regulator
MQNNLNMLLKELDVSKNDLASAIGVTRQTIFRVCRGMSPSIEVGLKIANFFNKDVKDIFFEELVQQVERNKEPKLTS